MVVRYARMTLKIDFHYRLACIVEYVSYCVLCVKVNFNQKSLTFFAVHVLFVEQFLLPSAC